MKNIHHLALTLIFCAVLLSSCSTAEGEFPGTEYMPDMGHSIAYEANVYNYYYLNTWDSASIFTLKELSEPRLPVAGTVPRGYAGVHLASTTTAKNAAMDALNGSASINALAVPLNGNVPYHYENTEEDRTRAGSEITDNPYPITGEGLARGKNLYTINCAVCHGKAGKGEDGGIYASGVYPAAPANLVNEEFTAASNGRYYHALMYGKNMMGSYADKLSYEERWQVIHYVRSLQAKESKLVYSADENTLNMAFGTPAGKMTKLSDATPVPAEGQEATDHNHEDGNGHGDAEHDHSEGDHSHDNGGGTHEGGH